MTFIILLILITFSIASSAAFFSVYGLAHTFSGTFIGTVVMGSSLEAGKLMAFSYIYRYWNRTHILLKTGLLIVSIGVMILTSLGIYGYLSYGYQADVLPLKQKTDQVKLLDDEKDRLLKRKSQIDDLLAQNTAPMVTNLQNADGIDRHAVAALNASVRSRDHLAKQYKAEQITVTTRIDQLDKEILPLKQDLIMAEAHTGPIVSIAKALNQDTDGAAKYLILLIICSFDPMAVFLTLSINNALKYHKVDKELARLEKMRKAKEDAIAKAEIEEILLARKNTVEPIVVEKPIEVIKEPPIEQTIDLIAMQAKIDEAVNQEKVAKERNHILLIPEFEEPVYIRDTAAEVAFANQLSQVEHLLALREADQNSIEEEITEVKYNLRQSTDQITELSSAIVASDEENAELVMQKAKLEDDLAKIAADYDMLLADKLAAEEKVKELAKIAADYDMLLADKLVAEEKVKELAKIAADYDMLLADKLVAEEKVKDTEEILRILNTELAETKVEPEPVKIEDAAPTLRIVSAVAPEPVPVPVKIEDAAPTLRVVSAAPAARTVKLPNLSAVADNFPLGGNASFGVEFPATPIKGDLFLRVDYMPSNLYKWSGTRWIEVDKNLTDSYLYDNEYIKLLVAKIASGEQDIDELTATEQDQIQAYLLQGKNG